MDPPLAWASLAPLLVLAVAVAVAVAAGWRAWMRRRRARVRARWAALGEARAREWLEARGFVVTGAQVARAYALRVDDATVPISVRADYLVTRGGVRYVAEVKTGALAPRVQTAATRRQLLEYKLAFGVDGVLLVDAEVGRIHEVTFPAPEARPPVRIVLALVAALAVAIVLALRAV